MTNTRRNKMYDNIVFDRRATTEFTGRWGVVDLDEGVRPDGAGRPGSLRPLPGVGRVQCL